MYQRSLIFTGLLLASIAAAHATAQISTGSPATARPESKVWCGNGRISDDLYAVKLCGPDSNRINLFFIGDGYRQPELPFWGAHVDQMVERLFSGESPPYERYRNFINVYRVDLVSNETGVDDPGSGVYVDTALDGCTCCIDYTIGQCQVDWAKTHAAFNNAAAGIAVHWRFVGLNTRIFAGGAHYPAQGPLAVYSTGNSERFKLLTHEGGHAFHLLADEYHYAQYDNDWYTGGEPGNVNLTINASGAKWAPWIGFSQPNLGGPVGAYEGGMVVYGKGIWRPSPQGRMNAFTYPLDAIGKERAIHSIYEVVDPIDVSAPDSAGTLPDDAKLFVKVVDPAVIKVEWRVDGQPVQAGEGTLNLARLNLPFGFHVVEVEAWDEVLDHAFSDNANPHPLDLVRRNMANLRQTITWTVFAN